MFIENNDIYSLEKAVKEIFGAETNADKSRAIIEERISQHRMLVSTLRKQLDEIAQSYGEAETIVSIHWKEKAIPYCFKKIS